MNLIYKLLKLGVWVENYCYYEMLSVWVVVAGAVIYSIDMFVFGSTYTWPKLGSSASHKWTVPTIS